MATTPAPAGDRGPDIFRAPASGSSQASRETRLNQVEGWQHAWATGAGVSHQVSAWAWKPAPATGWWPGNKHTRWVSFLGLFIANYKLGVLKHRNILSLRSGNQNYEIKVVVWPCPLWRILGRILSLFQLRVAPAIPWLVAALFLSLSRSFLAIFPVSLCVFSVSVP